MRIEGALPTKYRIFYEKVFIHLTNRYNIGRFVILVTVPAAHIRGAVMSQPFKDPFNVMYFVGLILVLLLPTLPASLSWLKSLGLI